MNEHLSNFQNESGNTVKVKAFFFNYQANTFKMKALKTLFYPSITFNMKDYSISASLYWVFSLFTLVYFFPFNKKNAVLLLKPNKDSVENNYSKCLYENEDVLANLYKQIDRGASKVWETTMIRRAQRHTFIRNSGVLGLSISQRVAN